MKIAVLTCTRDRLEYTVACFATLYGHAGCDFDHYIVDQGSEDGTVEWLHANTEATVYAYDENIGICPALNMMIDEALEVADYDVFVKVDNDAELLTRNTVRDVAGKAFESNMLLSPHVRGLRNTPQPIGHVDGVSLTGVIGGIFMAVPAWIFRDGYRHPIIATKDGDDWQLCRWYQHAHGGRVGYLDGYELNHFRTTDGQHEDFPEYFARRESERNAVGVFT